MGPQVTLNLLSFFVASALARRAKCEGEREARSENKPLVLQANKVLQI